MKTKDYGTVLDAIRPLAESDDPSVLENVLNGLCRCFGADSVGVSDPDWAEADVEFSPKNAFPEKFPWHNDATLLSRLRFSMTADVLADGDGEWLACLVRPTMLVWAYRRTKRIWSEEDRWWFVIAGQAIGRWRAQTPDAIQEDLEQAAVVASRLCHDFGNYLTGILGFTELGLTQTPADGLLHRYLEEVLQSAQKAADWIRRLHWFCRRAGGRVWPTPMSGLVAEEVARVGAGGSNVRIAVDVSPDLPLADIDASALRAAIAELVNNAKEASGGAATITVTARTVDLALTDCGALLGSPRPGSFLELTVADDGPGMAPQHRAKLFRELFFSTKPRQRGLGLLIVYGIMQQFHGGMQVSTAGTTGFCVRLFLPIACVAGPPFRPGEPPNVLAVHPNPLCLETMRKILEARGSRVTVATTADAALNTALSPGNSFELVVIETALPQHSGFILARKVYDHAHQTAFLFVQAHSILNNLDEDALLKRFPILRGPLNVPMFVDGVMSALAGANP